ncbi:DEAD/DEAH box helicase family protein [Shewanella decolorationis]|uniref:DEAD/DEAH box helicase family protein n=1 Tax=Shewanella decolorationis TaxID=256839 RepID=A0A5B8QSY7_9GAMM|nr:DEAD/DEAH box helicase family protein [Shewanella decolorationis]QDZ89036.1 DEAD/DEAH box helicase family protein [Shewanella decolorationis]
MDFKNSNLLNGQDCLALEHVEQLSIEKPIFLHKNSTPIGVLSKLAIPEGVWEFRASHIKGKRYQLVSPFGVQFIADIGGKIGKSLKDFKLKGLVSQLPGSPESYFEDVKITARNSEGRGLRPAQLGAIYSLLSHWSLSNDVATVVLPTGTGKTETMLCLSLADKATRTLVIVPTIDLKTQISEKFQSWGMLKTLNIIPNNTPYPNVLVLNKTISHQENIDVILESEVVISTPALFARSPDEIIQKFSGLFSHVFFDEAHHIAASEWQKLKSVFNNSKIVQFTATPYRNDRQPIEGKVVYNYPLSQALKDECFSKISLISIDERHPKKKDQAIANAAVSQLIKDRESGFTKHKIMVRAESRTHAEIIYENYKKWFPSENVALVHSNIKSRNLIIDEIKKDKYDIVVCVDMLKEGFDYPNFKIAAVHGVHKSISVLLQFIGRFTRTQQGLGDATFIVNYAEEKMSTELENLFQEGSGWEEIISEVADAKKSEAESLLTFLQGCKPISGFDSPDIELNPKLVYPALSCVCFKAKKVSWKYFKDAFNTHHYSLSQPFLNEQENVFYFTTQRRDKVKWARSDKMRDQKWDLIVMHFDRETNILYVGYSEKRLDIDYLVEAITQEKPMPIKGDCVFRSFNAIKRLSIVHAGIFKPANHLHRYSRLSGADVTTELTKWKEGKRCQKSDFVGIGFRDGFPVSVGASVKGKIWSPARLADLKEWKSWCLSIGKMITDEAIDSNQLLEDSASKTQIESFPENVIILATDWSEDLYLRIHKITVELPNSKSIMLSECKIRNTYCNKDRAEFSLNILGETVTFEMQLGGEKGHRVIGLDDSKIKVDGIKNNYISLKRFFEENPPTMFLLNGSTISGCIHTDYGDHVIDRIPNNQINKLDWQDVNFTIESMYKSSTKRKNSIQEYMMRKLANDGAKVVFNDDNSGESADIIAIFIDDNHIRFQLVHCKYSKEASGARLSDLYEVCGQALVSLRYKWRPEELLKHMERRNKNGVLTGLRFYKGNSSDIDDIKKALKYSDVSFEFSVAQPGVDSSMLTEEMKDFLGSIYSTIVEMTETRLSCYFS